MRVRVLLTGAVGVIVTGVSAMRIRLAMIMATGVIFPVLVVVGECVRAMPFARAEENESGRCRNDRDFS
jgi:hypothetical protein